jgi:4-alpha-glucanotransferase
VRARKLKKLRVLFESTFATLSKTKPYRDFVAEHPWLPTYVKYKAIKEEKGGAPWSAWGPSPPPPPQSSLDFHTFLQFHCFHQFEKVKAHAENLGVKIKGDIPILISPDSADVWSHPHLFDLTLSAGAPPDYYNPLGQNWGFPLFNWDAHRNTHFAWWKQRLQVASQLFHIYRIDHVVGFYRIWGIPEGNPPSHGHFIPPDPTLWPGQGREILEMMLNATDMLPIAEDLGTIPPMVYPMLKELGISGTKVVRWQKTQEGRFIPYDQYEPLSMTTVSTADLETTASWWKNIPGEAAPFAAFHQMSYQPTLTREQQFTLLSRAHHSSSYFHINMLQEYLYLFEELVSPNPDEERVNQPGTVLSTNWTYRFKPSLEELMRHEGLRGAIRQIHESPQR